MWVQVPMLGRFRYVGKPDRQHTSVSGQVACVVHMFVMHVAEELRTWPEQGQRQRYWVQSFERHSDAVMLWDLCVLSCQQVSRTADRELNILVHWNRTRVGSTE